jgi:branched-chain amino acid transport system ATP-binding protein
VDGGQVVGLLGRNGVGKSTTLKAIMGLVAVQNGSITFSGHDLRRQKPYRIPRLGVGYVPEDRRIFPRLTVLDNLRTGFDRPGASDARTEQLLDQAYASFPRLKERQQQLAGTLSGGEQQMLAIARAMMLDPQIILLDEPTEGLMPRLVGQIREIIEVLRQTNVSILLVEQNVPMTLAVSDRVYLMERGAIRHEAAASELSVDDDVIHKYLGV